MSWAFAILTEIGSKRRRYDEQQSWRPHGPMPSMSLVVSRAPTWRIDPRVELARDVADQLAEVDAVLGVEVDGDTARRRLHLDVHHLHREPSSARQLLAGDDRPLLAL